MFRSSRRRLRLLGRWPRWCAVGICLLLAGASALETPRRAAADPAAGDAVVVAARALPAGHVLTRRDLAVTKWPASLRPSGTVADPIRFVGDRLAGPLAAKEAVTTRRVLGADLTTGLATGQVATAIALDDPGIGALVHPGDRVDLVATVRADGAGLGDLDPAGGASPTPTSDPPATVVASHAVVLALLDTSTAPSGQGATAIVLATDRTVALRIAALRNTHAFAVLGDSP